MQRRNTAALHSGRPRHGDAAGRRAHQQALPHFLPIPWFPVRRAATFHPRNTKNAVSQAPDTLFKASQTSSSGSCSGCPRVSGFGRGSPRKAFYVHGPNRELGALGGQSSPTSHQAPERREKHTRGPRTPAPNCTENGTIKPGRQHGAALRKGNQTTPLKQAETDSEPLRDPRSHLGSDAARTPLWSRGEPSPGPHLPPFFPIRPLGAGASRKGLQLQTPGRWSGRPALGGGPGAGPT